MEEFGNPRSERPRRVVAVVAMAVTLYYLYWRVTATFNHSALFFSWSLWIAECFGTLTTFLFYFAVWRPLSRVVPPPLAGRTVDVLIPTLNEPVAVLRKTLLACSDLAYPHRTLLLDDGDRPEVKTLCDELGVIYLARERHEHAKAGNVNFGLAHSTAEFVAVFDADHAPLPHFIDRLIGYFRDEKLGFAQAPQEFYNIDSFQHRADHEKKYIWTEQGLFYNLIQPGRDRWNAAYFVGSCALMRRAAIDDVGGFATASITEDMLTSIRIHAKGWSSVYHNEGLAYGIAAETIHPFHTQRRRWGLGGWQVFFRATPPIVLFTGVLPMNALDITYLWHFVPYYALSLFAFNEMGRGYAGYLMLEQFSMGKFVTYLESFFSLFLPRRARQFKVTPKGETSSTPYRLMLPQAIVGLGSIAAILYAIVQLLLNLRGDEFIVAVNSLWALFNSGLALAIILYARTKFQQRRIDFRIFDAVPVSFTYEERGTTVRGFAAADDATESGLSLITVGRMPTNRELALEIMLPGKTLIGRGRVIHEKTAAAGKDVVVRAGVAVTGPERAIDVMSRYLHESAVSKFLDEYGTRYPTYIDSRLAPRRGHVDRAPRVRGFLAAIVRKEGGAPSFGVIRNVSRTGLLLAARENLAAGDRVTVEAIAGGDTLSLPGIVVRVLRYASTAFPECVAGVQFARAESGAVKRVLEIADAISTLW
ncbi:MAG: glycosyltransferase [Candidatus Krumholzibacteriaceae bacterium]